MPADRLPPLPYSVLPKGTASARYAMALAVGKGSAAGFKKADWSYDPLPTVESLSKLKAWLCRI